MFGSETELVGVCRAWPGGVVCAGICPETEHPAGVVVVDPERIHTAEELREQLGKLFRRGGWSINRLAAESGLSTSTVKAI
ncbi:hypothetical protein, partial [Actinomadura sp. KC216]|uniref:hypothetical protein n=1 Tax=Actinomadura sp. KC216 TaxID=2530370 RepID=UPI001A9EBE0D